MTQPKLIVIWGGEDILSSSIELFLAAKKDWKVVRIVDTEDMLAFKLTIERTQPDIVIIQKGDSIREANLPLQLLLNNTSRKVIMISMENNSLEVFSRHNMLVRQSSDLIAVIENMPDI